jgi:hypothetical protein
MMFSVYLKHNVLYTEFLDGFSLLISITSCKVQMLHTCSLLLLSPSREAGQDAIRVTAVAFVLCVPYIAAHVLKLSLTTGKTSKDGIASLSIWSVFGRHSCKTVPCHLLRTNTLISDKSKDIIYLYTNVYVSLTGYFITKISSLTDHTTAPCSMPCTLCIRSPNFLTFYGLRHRLHRIACLWELIPPLNWFLEGGGGEDPRTKSIPTFKNLHYVTWPIRFHTWFLLISKILFCLL